jgi:Mg2+ and Co2+ transporter CorA
MKRSKRFSPAFKVYIRALNSRIKFLVRILLIADSMLDNSEHSFNNAIEAKQTQLQTKLNQLMNTFSLMATVFLPLQLIAALWGMNVIVPW